MSPALGEEQWQTVVRDKNKSRLSKLALFPSTLLLLSSLEGVSWGGREEGERRSGYAYLPFLARYQEFAIFYYLGLI